MTPTYLNSSPSPYPLALGDDHYHHVYNPQASSSSSPPPPSQVLTYSFQDQGVNYPREVHQLTYQQDQGNFLAPQEENDHGGLKFWISKKEEEPKDEIDDHKWMPPKLRLIRKMKNSDQARVEAPISPQPVKLEDEKQASSSMETDGGNNNNSPIRVCSDCNTTKTPLWRSGPRGPKSLCNACGIRQRKARRAMAAAAAAAVNGGDLPAETSPAIKAKVVQHKKKRSNTNVDGHNAQHYKRRPKFLASTSTNIQSQGKKQLCFEDFLISLNKSLAIHQVFPQDEKEAAILLMALSCDLVHG